MRRGLDIADVEQATKIRAKYLRALENEEFGMLPGSTFAKTFLRTYSEYLGLDAQLLVEEFRAQHEPRGEGELPAFAPQPGDRMGRGRDGPPFGPGTVFAVGIVLLLVLFAIIGLSGGDDEGDGDNGPSTTPAARDERPSNADRRRRERRRAGTGTLRVRVVPAGLTYVCLDDGKGNRIFEGTITEPRTFRRRGRLRINLGRVPLRLTANGRRISIEEGPAGAGFSFSRSGTAEPLPPEQRPCT